MTLAKANEQDGMMLAKVKEQDEIMLAKVKEQDGMMLAKVKKQDGIMLANVKSKVSYISGLLRRSATDKMRNPLPIPFTTVNYLIGLRPPKHRYRISSKDSAPLIFRHVVAEMRTKPPNFGKRFGSSSQ